MHFIRMTMVVAICISFWVLVSCTINAFGAPPSGIDLNSPMAKYMQGLTDHDKVNCCGPETDCRFTQIRPSDTAKSGMAVWIDKQTYGYSAPDAWVDVPEDTLDPTYDQVPDTLQHTTIACWTADEDTEHDHHHLSGGKLTCVRPRSGS